MSPGYLDLHNHLLPGVDDGCKTMEETLGWLERFQRQGVTDLVFSPHLLAGNLDAATLHEEARYQRGRFELVRERTDGRTDLPRLHLGQEILARWPEDLERALEVEGVGMAGGGTLLVEFGFGPSYDGDGVLAVAAEHGRRVVVAHPERFRYGDRDPAAVAAGWREAGALLQVNGGSLMGLYSEAAHRIGVLFLREGLVDLVGTDHHGDLRPHDPAQVAAVVEELVGPEGVEALYVDGPRRALGLP